MTELRHTKLQEETSLTAEKKAQLTLGREQLLGTVLILISAGAFGFMAIFAKYAYKANLTTTNVLALRFIVAAVVMWVMVLAAGEDFRVGKKQVLVLAVLGATGYGLMSTFFFNAVRLIPASVASILLYTYPVLVTILSALIYKERITGYKVISLLTATTGLVMVVGAGWGGVNITGVFYGMMTAVVYAAYLLAINKLVGWVNPLVATTYVISSAALVFGLIGLITGSLKLSIGAAGWQAILGLAVVSTVIAIVTLFYGVKRIGPSKTSIISTVEPVVTTVAAFLLFSEKLGPVQTAGAGLVIAAVLIVQGDR